MTLSEPVTDVRARTHMGGTHAGAAPTSANINGRPHLRVIPGVTHIPNVPTPPSEDHAASDHLVGVVDDLATHSVTATHPPTVVAAAGQIWLASDEVRHGLAGQLAAAAVGLAQVVGLAACWGVAHVFFATKTRTAIFLTVLGVALTVWAVAAHI